MGEGRVDDVTTHPATGAMIEEYVAWYDRHFDPAWQDMLIAPIGRAAAPAWAYTLPRVERRPRSAWAGPIRARRLFLTAGNITHTPAYGHLIAMGVLVAAHEHDATRSRSPTPRPIARLIADDRPLPDLLRRRGAARLSACAKTRPSAPRCSIVRETDAGVVLSGKVGMHTSPAYAEDVYVGALNGVMIDGHPASFIVPVGGAGRDDAVPQASPRATPTRSSRRCRAASTSSTARCGSTTCSSRGSACSSSTPSPEPIAALAALASPLRLAVEGRVHPRLALALTDAMGLKEHEPTVEYLVDLIAEVQTVRACLTAAERDPEFTAERLLRRQLRAPAAGGIAMFKARQRISEILRIVPGSSLVVAPSDSDLADPELAAGLEECFGGGGYTARQRVGVAAARLGPCVVGARRARIRPSNCMPAAACRRGAAAAAQLHRLQRARQRAC